MPVAAGSLSNAARRSMRTAARSSGKWAMNRSVMLVRVARAVRTLELVLAEHLLPLVMKRAVDLAMQRDAQLVDAQLHELAQL